MGWSGYALYVMFYIMPFPLCVFKCFMFQSCVCEGVCIYTGTGVCYSV